MIMMTTPCKLTVRQTKLLYSVAEIRLAQFLASVKQIRREERLTFLRCLFVSRCVQLLLILVVCPLALVRKLPASHIAAA